MDLNSREKAELGLAYLYPQAMAKFYIWKYIARLVLSGLIIVGLFCWFIATHGW